MKNSRVARRYASALLDEADQQKLTDVITRDLNLIAKTLSESREFRRFVVSPVVSESKKKKVFEELFGKRMSAQVLSFVNFLISKHREALLADIVEQFDALRDEKLGFINVNVTSAVEMLPPQERALQDQLERYTRKKVRVRFSLDKRIKGGLVVKIGDTVLDSSIRNQLELLRERLVHGGPLSN
jgi:F-type H+-transporting ATPase subunit delta